MTILCTLATIKAMDVTKYQPVNHSQFRSLLWLLIIGWITTGCSQPDALDRIQQEQVLHVVTHPAPTVYVEEGGQASGFEYDMVRLFADHLGVELRLEVVDDLPELFDRLDQGHTHFAAAGLGIDTNLSERYEQGPAYLRTRPIVVYRAGNSRPEGPGDLVDQSIMVRSGGPHEHRLERIREVHPDLEWESRPDVDATELLHRVHEGELDLAIISANELQVNKVYFNQVREAFPLDSTQPIAWLFPNTNNESLRDEARRFFRNLRQDGTLAQLEERHYGHLDRLDYVGARTFVRHLENRLPRYRTTFMEAAEAHDLDWRLLAAIGYQESHWRPDAVSPTGVRGLMMLTRPTAAHMGVDNRLDPTESIWGGARYFRQLTRMIPNNIPEPDRTWFALAAYNVGYGHLEDARILTERGGKDPTKWMDVKEFLPRLAQRQWYTQTRHGYARGHEPVIYTQNIRRYYDVLKWMYPDEPDEIELASDMDSPLSEGAHMELGEGDSDESDDSTRDRERRQATGIRITPPTL